MFYSQAGPDKTVILKEGKQWLVPTALASINVGVKAQSVPFNVKLGEWRNRKTAAFVSTLGTAALQEWICSIRVRHYVVATTEAGCCGLLFEVGTYRHKAPDNTNMGVPISRSTISIVSDLMKFECQATVSVQSQIKASYTEEDILELARPYSTMTKACFEALMLAMTTWPDLSPDQQFVMDNAHKIRNLRQAILEDELAKSFLCFPNDPNILSMKDFVGLDKLLAKRVTVDGTIQQLNFTRAYMTLMETCTFIFGGKSRTGKTSLAKAMAAQYMVVRKMPFFAMTSTVDSLRLLSTQGYFQPFLALVIDEWRIGSSSQDANADKVDFIKCLTDIQQPGSVRVRYNDIRFSPMMPRTITSQMKMQQWLDFLAAMEDQDRLAILARLVFVDFDTPVVPKRLSESFRQERASDLMTAFTDAGFAPAADGTLGGWVDI